MHTLIAPPPITAVDQVIQALAFIVDPEMMRGTAAWLQAQQRELQAKATDNDVLGAKLSTREKAATDKESELAGREAAIVTAETNARNTHDAALNLLAHAEETNAASKLRAASVEATAAQLAETQRQLSTLIATKV